MRTLSPRVVDLRRQQQAATTGQHKVQEWHTGRQDYSHMHHAAARWLERQLLASHKLLHADTMHSTRAQLAS
jgi:hypothetical protein